FTIPVQIDLGVRLGGVVFLGGYFSYGFAGSSKCTGSCSPSTLRFGGQIHWHPLGNAGIDPWIGLGSGDEKVRIGASDGSAEVSGWEFGNLQVGVDFALASAVKLGPWVSFSIGQYSSASVTGTNGSGITGDLPNKTIHEWIMGGVRLVIIP